MGWVSAAGRVLDIQPGFLKQAMDKGPCYPFCVTPEPKFSGKGIFRPFQLGNKHKYAKYDCVGQPKDPMSP